MSIKDTVNQLTELIAKLIDITERLEIRTEHLRPRAGTVCNTPECFPNEDRSDFFIRHDHTHGGECSVDCPCELGVPIGDFPGGAYPSAGPTGLLTFTSALPTPKPPAGANADEVEAWVKKTFPRAGEVKSIVSEPQQMIGTGGGAPTDWQLRIMGEYDTSVGEIDREK